MAKNDWYEAGEEIKKLVQDAVERQDFSQLSDTIAGVVNQTVDGIQSALKESLNGSSPKEGKKSHQEAAERIRREMNAKNRQSGQEYAGGQRSGQGTNRNGQEFRNANQRTMRTPGKIVGTVMAWTGYSFSAVFGLALGIMITVGYSTGIDFSLIYGILGLLFGGSFWLGWEGGRRVGLANRFRRYRDLLSGRTFCAIEELASGTGKSIGYVRKDLKNMIQKGYFLEGHLDRKGTCLITDHETYQQYLQAQQGYDRRQEESGSGQRTHGQSCQQDEELKKTETQSAPDTENSETAGKTVSGECRALLEEGNRYIRHIRKCNDLIPGEEISAKLDRLELVVTRIFREVERRPELAPELRKMMNYYLPTTQKLLDAYCSLDAQTIGGQNIDTTKKEIENALDTINLAFENLLDGFFEHTAWDISSDISVLNTMFAQEGLTGKDFEE